MKILVTGGTGFAGRHLLRRLTADASARVFGSYLEAIPRVVREDRTLEWVEWLPLDLCSRESVRRLVEVVLPDRVFHLAGQASVGESFEDPLRTWQVNATGSLLLLETLGRCSRRPQRMLLVSSAEVYGEVETEAQPIREEAAFSPVTPYGASKAAAELAGLQLARAHGIELVIARSFNHIGPGQDERFVLPSIARQLVGAERGETPPVIRVGNTEVTRDFLDVRDVVDAYSGLMEVGEAGRAYNVCSGVPRSLRSVLDRMIEIAGSGASLEVDPERMRSVDIPLLVGDPGRLTSLGWTPKISLDQTLAELLAEARQGV